MNVEYRFSENRAAVLKMCDCVGNYRVKGLDHQGNKFRTSIGQWNRLELATEEDYCDFFKRDNHISNNPMPSDQKFPELTDEEIMELMPVQLKLDLETVVGLAALDKNSAGIIRVCLNHGIVSHCRTAILTNQKLGEN